MKRLTTPIPPKEMTTLRAGDTILLSGTLYTARDAAHARLCESLRKGEPLPVDLQGQIFFYAGPSPAPPNRPIGSIGPTTSVRMDAYTPALLRNGLAGMIGKGERGEEVRKAIMAKGAVYFAAVGGCAAYMASCIIDCQVVAYDDLGTESIKRLTVKDLPLTVALDSQGNDYYRLGMQKYAKHRLP